MVPINRLFVVFAGAIGSANGKVLAFRSRTSALGRTQTGGQRAGELVEQSINSGGVLIQAVGLAAYQKLTRR